MTAYTYMLDWTIGHIPWWMHSLLNPIFSTYRFPQVTPEIVQDMRDYFAPHNSRLEELIGRPLPNSWSKSPS